MKYTDNEIKDSIFNFIGEEGREYFRNLKDEHGTCWVREKQESGWSIHNWTNEGRQIRNHVLKNFPDIVEELGGDYGNFEEYMYNIVEEMFE